MQEQKLIYKIEDVEVGDIAYFEGVENGARVVDVDPQDSSRLLVEAPEEYKPFNIFGDTAVWLQNSFFKHAIRQTLNKPVEKRLPDVQVGQLRVFKTTSGASVIYDGSTSRNWTIESFLSDKRLLELLDPSQFPLKNMTEEES